MPPQGPFCQSCSMPMGSPELFGTCADGSTSSDFCTYCYQNGKFTEPAITLDEMIEKCTAILVHRKIMPADKAKQFMQNMIPLLKRWALKPAGHPQATTRVQA